MSRLIVKNLPTYLTPAGLRSHFEQRGAPPGTITDVRVSHKPDGTTRRFGFIGFKSDGEAAAAREYFDRTFIDSTRIRVEVVEDAPVPRPNKRRRIEPGKPAAVTQNKGAKDEKRDENQLKSKPHLDKFLEISRSHRGRSWANETDTSHPILPPDEEEQQQHDTEGQKQDDSVSDLEWMKQRMTHRISEPRKVFQEEDEDQEENRIEDAPQPQEEDRNTATILQTGRLFLRNLAFSCTDVELQEPFQPFGEIDQVHLPIDSISKQPKGFAYIKFKQPSSALAAYQALDKKSFQGRLLHILPAVDRPGKLEVTDRDGKKSSLKEERNAKRKGMAGRDFNWSTLYMNSDAVASSIADRLSISKADILNPESDNAAVKLALAETHVIQETKAYLESQGVILSAFSSRARSDTTILVKNIPYGTTADQIREMFEVHGKLDRVLVPPAGTIAVVEFEHADEAKKAFRALAYRRLGNSILYLEKGPLGMLAETTRDDDASPTTLTAFKPVVIAEQGASDGAGKDDEPPLSAGTTLFVKNLAFSTTSERLRQVFGALPEFSFARVQTKPDPKRPKAPGEAPPRLSMGYGFVGFKTPEGAQKAIKSMQGFVLDGHALHVKFAGRGKEEEEESKDNKVAKARTTKVIVKNVPFEASKKDIRELFGAHGQLKSVRLPKKFDSRSRGFAFLEFLTRREAENAFAALKHTHLLGRHLVLEWAEEAEQDIEVLRKKAGVGYWGGAELPGRKRKLNIGEDDELGGAEDGVME
ncbi:hypothetical protein EDD15DRAFT_2169533 [Pisolithus albus]|nr:hypothetical protein EDD15DRAFT_2169533 [Pisolithus albus]